MSDDQLFDDWVKIATAAALLPELPADFVRFVQEAAA